MKFPTSLKKFRTYFGNCRSYFFMYVEKDVTQSAFLFAHCGFADRCGKKPLASLLFQQCNPSGNVTPEKEVWRQETMQEPRRTFFYYYL